MQCGAGSPRLRKHTRRDNLNRADSVAGIRSDSATWLVVCETGRTWWVGCRGGWWSGACIDTAMVRYLISGELPPAGTICKPDALPFEPISPQQQEREHSITASFPIGELVFGSEVVRNPASTAHQTFRRMRKEAFGASLSPHPDSNRGLFVSSGTVEVAATTQVLSDQITKP